MIRCPHMIIHLPLVDEDDDIDVDEVDIYLHLDDEGHDSSTPDGSGQSSYGETVPQSSRSNSK